jgi:GxxExxY protein
MQPSKIILEASLKIHKELGPGLFESVYRDCLAYELEKNGLLIKKEITLPIQYESLKFDNAYRADLIVNDKIIIEVKSVEKIIPLHRAQLLTYLKLSRHPLGLLINFGDAKIKENFFRFANGDIANEL